MKQREPSVVCPMCGKRTYRPEDIQEPRYCPFCHLTHEEMRPHLRRPDFHPRPKGKRLWRRTADTLAAWGPVMLLFAGFIVAYAIVVRGLNEVQAWFWQLFGYP